MFSLVVNNNEQQLVDLPGSSIFVDGGNSYIVNSQSRSEKILHGLTMWALFKAPIDFVPEVAVRVWRV